MNILITNDDGINAIGLKQLVSVAIKYGKCTVVAPKVEQSAKSHSLNLRKNLEFKKVEEILPGVDTYYLDSTPADCVRVAYSCLNTKFDLVLSGVNDGYNLGEDIHYSGTMAAATEAAILGINALAFSSKYTMVDKIHEDLEKVMTYVMENKLLDIWPLYNINIPYKYKEIKYGGQGHTHFEIVFEKGDGYVKSVGRPEVCEDDNEYSDVYLVYNDYVSIAPLRFNRTNKQIIEKLSIK